MKIGYDFSDGVGETRMHYDTQIGICYGVHGAVYIGVMKRRSMPRDLHQRDQGVQTARSIVIAWTEETLGICSYCSKPCKLELMNMIPLHFFNPSPRAAAFSSWKLAEYYRSLRARGDKTIPADLLSSDPNSI